jgi:Tol biopolymer transport system component
MTGTVDWNALAAAVLAKDGATGKWGLGKVRSPEPEIIRANTSADGGQENGESSGAAVSADATRVAFHSWGSNLVPEDTNGVPDVFVKAMKTGAIARISVSASGNQGNDSSFNPVISADGTKVAFYSWAGNLVPGDTNGTSDVFVKDRETGILTLVSTSAAGEQLGFGGHGPQMSADGRLVAFGSQTTEVYVKDLETGRLVLASTNSDGESANGPSGGFFANGHAISANGRFVAFASLATNLDPSDRDDTYDIFVKDLRTGTVRLASASDLGDPGNGWSDTPSLSANGRFVAFESAASNLVPGDGNGVQDVFVQDMKTGRIWLASANADGVPGDEFSGSFWDGLEISPDGRFVAFRSRASNLVQNDTNGETDVFIKDLRTGGIKLVSASADGMPGNGSSDGPTFSADGDWLAFYSSASNLVPGDTNGTTDVFIRDLEDGHGKGPPFATDCEGPQEWCWTSAASLAHDDFALG